MTNIESERKFLITKALDTESWPVEFRTLDIKQRYLTQETVGSVERIRSQTEDGHVSLILCMKEHIKPGVNKETEIKINTAEWMMLQESVDPSRGEIRKTRYVFDWDGLTWELDVFSNPNLLSMMLEVELDDIEQEVEVPAFLVDMLNKPREVTGDPSWSNYAISVVALEKE